MLQLVNARRLNIELSGGRCAPKLTIKMRSQCVVDQRALCPFGGGGRAPRGHFATPPAVNGARGKRDAEGFLHAGGKMISNRFFQMLIEWRDAPSHPS